MENLLLVEELCKNFGGLRAVNNLTFQAPPNLITSIIGPNGAGKTTVFNLITGFYLPTSGKIEFGGKEVTGWRPHQLAALGIARTFQTTSYFSEKSVEENLLIAYHVRQKAGLWDILARSAEYHREEREVRQRAEKSMEFLNIASHRAEAAKEVPTMIKQLLAIGMALMVEPQLLLLDEPASGMTAEEAERLMKLIHEIKGLGVTVIIIEHRMRMVMGISDKIVVLNFGEKIAEGTPDEIRKDSAVIKAYLGKEYAI